MSAALAPGAVAAASAIALELEPVPADQVVSGAPRTAYAVLDAGAGPEPGDGPEIGVWEMSPGAMQDVEADEVFVVLSGAATVEFVSVPGEQAPPAIELGPGSVVRLGAGMETIWTVRETLRKVYFA